MRGGQVSKEIGRSSHVGPSWTHFSQVAPSWRLLSKMTVHFFLWDSISKILLYLGQILASPSYSHLTPL